MNRWSILLAVFFFASLTIRAEDAPSATAPTTVAAPVTDPAQVAAHFHEVLARPEYQESEEPDLSSRLKDSLSQWFLRLGAKFGQFQYSGEMPAFASLLMTVLVMLSVAGLLYVAIRLTRRRAKMELESSASTVGPRTFHPPEFYDDEIQQATQGGNWHGAWLATWRQFLSRLENRHLVEADRTRTNREYLAQLHVRNLPAPALSLVGGMVDSYDRTIYGRQPVAEPDWQQFHRQIEEAGLLLNLSEKDTRLKPRES